MPKPIVQRPAISAQKYQARQFFNWAKKAEPTSHAKEVPADFANSPSLEIWIVGCRDLKEKDASWWNEVSFVKTEVAKDKDVSILYLQTNVFRHYSKFQILQK